MEKLVIFLFSTLMGFSAVTASPINGWTPCVRPAATSIPSAGVWLTAASLEEPSHVSIGVFRSQFARFARRWALSTFKSLLLLHWLLLPSLLKDNFSEIGSKVCWFWPLIPLFWLDKSGTKCSFKLNNDLFFCRNAESGSTFTSVLCLIGILIPTLSARDPAGANFNSFVPDIIWFSEFLAITSFSSVFILATEPGWTARQGFSTLTLVNSIFPWTTWSFGTPELTLLSSGSGDLTTSDKLEELVTTLEYERVDPWDGLDWSFCNELLSVGHKDGSSGGGEGGLINGNLLFLIGIPAG